MKKSTLGNGEYYFVSLPTRDVYVSRTMATFVEEQLTRWRPPKWIVFVDLFGSRVRVLSATVWAVAQCSEEQRAAERAFERRCQHEWQEDASDEQE